MEEKDIKETQIFAIRNIITVYCGQILSPNRIEEIVRKIEEEINKGACSWAFKIEGLKYGNSRI